MIQTVDEMLALLAPQQVVRRAAHGLQQQTVVPRIAAVGVQLAGGEIDVIFDGAVLFQLVKGVAQRDFKEGLELRIPEGIVDLHGSVQGAVGFDGEFHELYLQYRFMLFPAAVRRPWR